jgi:hypothetical protein
LLTFLAINSVAGEGRSTGFTFGRLTIHIVYRDQLKSFDYRLDPERSRAYLADLASDFFSPLPLLWLPFETICGKSALRKAITSETTDAVAQVAFHQLMIEQFTDSVDMQAELAGAVVTPDILDHARRRLRIFLT